MAWLAKQPELATAVLIVGEQRRVSTDAMMWQVPALSLTAQTFLLTIVLGSSATAAGRAIAAMVGLVVALGALMQMLKHRYHEEMLSRWLEIFEEHIGLPLLHAVQPGGAMLTTAKRKPEPKHTRIGKHFLNGPAAYTWWARLLGALAILDVVLAVLAILGVIHAEPASSHVVISYPSRIFR
jgi:hypothetical protein